MKPFGIVASAALASIALAQTQPVTDAPTTQSAVAPSGALTHKPGTGAGPQPPYTPVRWNEDYSYLKDASRRSDWLDPIKYIPLSDDGQVWISFGGQARYRYEWFNDANFGAGPQDDDGFHLGRVLAHADLHVGPSVRFFVQGIGAWQDGRVGGERPAIDENDADFHQAFVDLKIPIADDSSLLLRGGRQNLLYGAQRLISPLDWTNTRRTFDGGKISLQTGKLNTLDFFFVHPVIVDEGPLDSFTDDQTFTGIYNTTNLVNVLEGAGTKLDTYFLYLDREDATFRQGTAEENRYTVGARFFTNPKPWDFDVEAAYQFGDFGDDDISAWMVGTEVGYTFASAALSPRLFVGFDYASGDDDPTDGDLETFNQLYPLAHAYYGYADLLGRQNAIDLHPGLELTLAANQRHIKKMTLRATYHLFWRASEDDAIYTVAGAISRAGTGSDERYIGSEIDLLLNWTIDRHWSAYFGYSHVFAGGFIEDTGADNDIDFLYAAVQYTF